MRWTTRDRLIYLGAGTVPILTAVALVPLREAVVNANVALVLVVTVVAFSASGRRLASVIAAGSAAAAFDLLHTEPHLSLRINSSDDVETSILLLVLGLIVGEIAVRGRRAKGLVERERADLASIRGLGALVAEGESADFVVLATASELTHLLGLVDCRYVTGERTGPPLPTVVRDGSTWWGPTPWRTERWGFPSEGVAVPVLANGREVGRFVLSTPVGLPITPDQLLKAVALADQAGAAMVAGHTSAG